MPMREVIHPVYNNPNLESVLADVGLVVSHDLRSFRRFLDRQRFDDFRERIACCDRENSNMIDVINHPRSPGTSARTDDIPRRTATISECRSSTQTFSMTGAILSTASSRTSSEEQRMSRRCPLVSERSKTAPAFTARYMPGM